MTPKQKAALKRLRRKLEVMHFELRQANNTRHHDLADMLALVEVLEKET